MNDEHVSRRNFAALTTAAVGGMVVGAGPQALGQDAKPELSVDPALLLSEPHVCRGLNTCKGKGKGDHACAGQGGCATAEKNSCSGQNTCKGKGGCGGYPGQNTCSGKGHCAVPLGDKAWALARKQFEHLAKDVGMTVGKAPTK